MAVRRLLFVLATSVFLSNSVCAEDIPVFHPAAKPWAAEWGSHRALVHVDSAAEVARVLIPWRRRDFEPERKAVVVVALKDGKPVARAAPLHVTAESGEVVFTPSAGPGDYAVHYLPVKITGGAFPKSQYPAHDPKDMVWAAAVKNATQGRVTGWEAITAQDAFTEMEIIATSAETETVHKRFASEPFATFVEDREHAIRMFDHLPYRWTQPREVVLKAQPGEHCVFQLAVWAHRSDVSNAVLESAGLTLGATDRIEGKAFTCYNTQGVDWNGKPLSLTVNVPAGHVQPLWCGVTVPRDAKPGRYSGEAIVGGGTNARVRVPLTLEVAGEVLADRGVSSPQSLAKLQWLNSTAGISNEPTRGYTPVDVKGRVLKVLGREVELGEDGLPQRITSFFNPAVTKIGTSRLELLAKPMRFVSLETDDRTTVPTDGQLKFVEQTPGRVAWATTLAGGEVKFHGSLEFDGSLHYRVEVTGNRSVKDFRLEIPRTSESTPLIVGMGREAGVSKDFEWKWDVANKNQDSVWIGAVNGGLRLQLRGENYERPGVNIHYKRRPLNAPPAWWNENRGGVKFVAGTTDQSALITAFSGPRELTKEPLHFDFDLLVTPFHPLQTKEQWKDRYYHTGGVPADVAGYLEKARKGGATVVNVHQGNSLNPYINYPFLTSDRLRAFADAAHERGLRSKYYYTVRELSNWAPELFAFRSMGNEILLRGKGGGHPWLEEHLGGDYWQAWYEPGARDVSLLTAPMSRLHNFYLEGLRWLVENAGCDGIYLDDIAYDRAIMLRARRVLDQYCPRPALIDLHSWNEFHSGGAFAQCVNLFMDSLPFVDRLWFGEGHHYTGPSADHF
ncbi:MAG TPA: glycoside hydrolase domain-containing protein, partial [Chthoniobacteraceae bacterium]|nr:glycoside hydrolase domain-containing protein [Chthoniobacteraceae bacterium]